MGCFDRTCHLTNTPIHYGEEVVEIILGKKIEEVAKKGINKLMNYINNKHYEYTKHGDSLSTGDHLEILEDYTINIGNYDDYGGVEGNNITRQFGDISSLLFHKWALEHILGDKIENIKKIDFLKNLLISLFLYRRGLGLDLELVGIQYGNKEELTQIIEFNNKINNYLIEKIKEI